MIRKSLIVASAACALTLFPAMAWSSDAPAVGKRFALVVGISDYPGTLLDLPLVSEDVKAINSLLHDHLGFAQEHVRVLENEQATRQAILGGIREFLGQAGQNDLAVLYYSGHGTRVEGNVALEASLDPEADGQDEALVAYDQLLVDDEVAYALDSLTAGRLLVLFDSCHSGDATRADLSRGMPKFAEPEQWSKYIELPEEFQLSTASPSAEQLAAKGMLNVSEEGRLFLAASDESELSWVAADLGLSLFTYFLTDRLPGSTDLTFEEMMAEISPRVTQYAQQYFQVPQSSHIEGSSVAAQMRIGDFFRVDEAP